MVRRRIGYNRKCALLILGGIWGLGLLGPARTTAQSWLPRYSDFQINTYTTSHQQEAEVAVDLNGNFVVVWSSLAPFGTDPGGSIQGQRFASDGSALGSEFQINTYTTSLQSLASVAMDPGGDFVVVWESFSPTLGDIRGRRYASNGSPEGVDFRVNAVASGNQGAPSVAAAGNGDFVAVWAVFDLVETGVLGRRFASNGSAQSGDFLINTHTTGFHYQPSIATAADGGFVVVWTSKYSETDTFYSVQGQRYASDGSVQGGQFEVNTYTTGRQQYPDVSTAADGGFVVVWASYGSSGTDTSARSIQGQRYSSDGAPQGLQFQVNTYTSFHQAEPSVSMHSSGDFVVVWENGVPSIHSLQGQRYASNGSPEGPQFQVNTYTTGTQYHPSVAATDHSFVVTWDNNASSGTDTSGRSVQGRRYIAATGVPSMSPAASFALAAALLLLGAAYALRRRA